MTASENTLRDTVERLVGKAVLLNDKNYTDDIMQAFTAAVETVIGEDYLTPSCLNYPEESGTHCNKCFNCRVYYHGNDGSMTWDEGYDFKTAELYKRLAEMVGKTKEGESFE